MFTEYCQGGKVTFGNTLCTFNSTTYSIKVLNVLNMAPRPFHRVYHGDVDTMVAGIQPPEVWGRGNRCFHGEPRPLYRPHVFLLGMDPFITISQSPLVLLDQGAASIEGCASQTVFSHPDKGVNP